MTKGFMSMSDEEAKQIVLLATKRATVDDALAWISEGHDLSVDMGPRLLVAVSIQQETELQALALRRLVREKARSEIDTASVLFSPDRFPSPDRFRRVLDLLARKSSDGALTGLRASGVIAAQREDAFTIEVLCEIAGLSYRDLRERLTDADLPNEPGAAWKPSAVTAAFAVIDGIVRGQETTTLTGAIPARPLEHIVGNETFGALSGWALVESLRRDGIPFEYLLAQRHVGSAWGIHRNRTSSDVNRSIASRLCERLDERGVAYRRSTALGGTYAPKAVQELTGGGKEIGLVALDRSETPICGVVFSTARDSGSARTTARKLRANAMANVPIAVVVSGRGWAARDNETAALAIALDGRLFSDTSLDDLAQLIGDATLRPKAGD